jgi:hypothetical protein
MVVVASRRDADDFAAWQSLQRDHGEQILPHRCVIGSKRGRSERSREACGRQNYHRPNEQTFAHNLS